MGIGYGEVYRIVVWWRSG